MLFERVQRSIPSDLFIVPQSTPIPFFGNYSSAKACTISINPSYREFSDRRGLLLKKERLTSRAQLKCADAQMLSVKEAQVVIQSCNMYFKNNPYRGWFDKYEEYIRHFGYSYYDDSCVHLDLVQWATSPIWSRLPETVKNRLLQDDIPFLEHLIGKGFERIFLNGKTTVSQVASSMSIKLTGSQIKFQNRNATIYQGTLKNADVIGCSLYLQSQGVGGYKNVGELAEIVLASIRT